MEQRTKAIPVAAVTVIKVRNNIDMSEKILKNIVVDNYHRTNMQKEIVLKKLRSQGCRITRQRQVLLDIILQEECASCKEIYYKAASVDSGIGHATVYRMIRLLEDVGAISRKNMYKISSCMECDKADICTVRFDDGTACTLSAHNWYEVMMVGMKACGYAEEQKIVGVSVEQSTLFHL